MFFSSNILIEIMKSSTAFIIDLTEIVAPEIADISFEYKNESNQDFPMNCLSHLLLAISPP